MFCPRSLFLLVKLQLYFIMMYLMGTHAPVLSKIFPIPLPVALCSLRWFLWSVSLKSSVTALTVLHPIHKLVWHEPASPLH